MDKDVETAIVKTFFNKRVQDRILLELFSSDKRRNRGLNRLCHHYRQTLREEYLIEIPTPNSDPKEIADILKRNGAGKSFYAMSWNPDIDGKHLSIDEALDAVTTITEIGHEHQCHRGLAYSQCVQSAVLRVDFSP